MIIWPSAEGYSYTTSKLYAAHTLRIKFKPNHPNPQAPAPTPTQSPTMVVYPTVALPTAVLPSVVLPSVVQPTVTQGEVGKPANANVDLVEKMLGLKQLLDGGVLTQEEFDQKKGELLGQM
jgi:hypothetical protein